ncbi:MAG: hypothetical protein WBQ44_13955, partial [Rhodococcus sp. (in: high G+C Gram-positive bacteria)]
NQGVRDECRRHDQEPRALWRDRQRLSAVLGEFASVDGTGDTQFVWTVSSPTGEIVCPTEMMEDAKSIRYARTDGSVEHGASDLARISFEIAPKDLGTEVSLELALPVPDFVAKVAAFKVLYRARALLQTGEFPTLVPTPAARPGDR